jgi:hypothetical protein
MTAPENVFSFAVREEYFLRMDSALSSYWPQMLFRSNERGSPTTAPAGAMF